MSRFCDVVGRRLHSRHQTKRTSVCLVLHVGLHADLVRQRLDVDLEALLHARHHLLVGQLRLTRLLVLLLQVVGQEADGQTLGAETSGTAHPVQVRVRGLRHVVLDDDVDTVNVDTTAEQVRGDADARLELLELLVRLDTLVLLHLAVDAGAREAQLLHEGVEHLGALRGLHEDHDLVELQVVEEVVQLRVLLRLVQLDVVLLQTVQRQLRLRVHVDLQGLLHELLRQLPDLLRQRRREHHDLLRGRALHEHVLHVPAHVQLLEELVGLVHDEVLDVVRLQDVSPHQVDHAARRAHADGREVVVLLLEQRLVGRDGHAAVEDAHLRVREVLREADELPLDLVRQLARVHEHDALHHLLVALLNLVERGQHEHGRLAHAGLGLREDVLAEDGGRDGLVLHLGGVLETVVRDGTVQLRLQQEVAEAPDLGGGVAGVGLLLGRGRLGDLLLILEVEQVLLLLGVRHCGRWADEAMKYRYCSFYN
eukprot:Rhum_TRINITY_DN22786_c0_g1::Rhum_TRINITY_DN22786_c0_g1_i1::g.176016::m.176016